ncbi:MAG: alpha-1,6-mannanase [Bacteroidia bacterium]|nr:alpha-1,6-mannanase [Bacteroidia bacterium]
MKHISFALLLVLITTGCGAARKVELSNIAKAQSTLDSVYRYYSVQNTTLLRETFPFNSDYAATYLDNQDQAKPNPYSFLWPYSGSLSAVSAIMMHKKTKGVESYLTAKVLPGLAHYFDTIRSPFAYASYINDAPPSDRFYDDNVWLGIDFTELYLHTSKAEYLEKAKLIWKFIESGTDEKLGGGIYWCEQSKKSKNTCSNAPGAVYALKLFEATKDSSYFKQGKALYEWTKNTLQDKNDYLYFDNIGLNGRIQKRKYAYNSGQMLQAAALLYKLTDKKEYLVDAQNIAQSAHNYFFEDFSAADGSKMKILKKGDIWFTAIMFRGFVELYHLDKNKTYLQDFDKNLNFAWKNMREQNGLFNSDWSGQTKDKSKWLLTQFAMAEMYARMPELK